MKVSPLPTDSTERKGVPMLSGLLNYFPAGLAGVAIISRLGNEQHNKGQPLHHARGKSMDHGDCIIRHTVDVEAWKAHIERTGVSAEAVNILLTEARYRAWRSLAELQELEEKYAGAPLAPGARLPEEPVPAPAQTFGLKTREKVYRNSQGEDTCQQADPAGDGFCSRASRHGGPHAAHEAHRLEKVPYLYWGGDYHLTLREHLGIARDWHRTCTDDACWCHGTNHHNPR